MHEDWLAGQDKKLFRDPGVHPGSNAASHDNRRFFQKEGAGL
jgi:hypothetical protein